MAKSAPKKVLIVEDETILLKALNIELLTAGFEVLSASNGKAGLQLIKDEKPDLILLDMIMPGMSGFEVLQELKKSKTHRKTPVIILSNLGEEDDKQRALDLGADDYFVKSTTNLEYVTEKINKLL